MYGALQVSFEPPRVSLPGGISLAVGPSSSVVLSTTYLDERVRLGKGGRGSSFVFTRGGVCEHAGKHRALGLQLVERLFFHFQGS